ncbi:MAG: AAA family ATPase [Phycisphaerae bacterium]
MKRLHEPVSAWIESLDGQLIRSKHVLLHGNTSDLALYSGTTMHAAAQSPCMMFREALHRYLRDAGFVLVLHYDLTDGLQVADPSMMDSFRCAYAAGTGAAEGPQLDRQLNLGGDAPAAAESIRQLLRQDRVPCAVVMYFADKLVGDPQHQNPDELQLLIRLKHAMEDAHFAEKQTDLRNTFIGVASQLTAVPGWVYVDNPRLALVPVSRPNARERRPWINARLPEFHGAVDLSQERKDDLVRELADRTDGMSLFDISLLPRVSHVEQIPLESLHELVRAARFGKKQNPWRELDNKRLGSAAQLLGARVKGQPVAVKQVVSMLLQASVGISLGSSNAHGGPPQGVFLFVGPTGVGKTELAKAMAQMVSGDDDNLKVFDMAEYQLEHAGDRLAGAPPGFVGYEQGGQLTNHVLAQPFNVILFDEMEKAHASVYDKFLGILEEGRLTDGRGMTAYFDQSVLVFTSNIGSDRLMERLQTRPKEPPTYEELRALYMDAVQEHFARKFGRPELLGRFGDNIIVFDMLRPELVTQLCAKFLVELVDNARRQRQIDLRIDLATVGAYLTRLMQEPANLALGGRRVRELIKTVVVRPLNVYIFTSQPAAGTRLYVTLSEEDGHLSIRNDTTP